MVACGGGEPPPSKSPAAVSVVSQEPDVVPEPLPATVVDLVGTDAEVFVYFDAKAFRKGTLYAAIMNVVNGVPLVREKLAELTQTCGFNPVDALSEVAFSARVKDRDLDMDTAVLAARSSESSSASLECIQRLMPEFERVEVDGQAALGLSNGYVVALEPFLVAGEPEPVRRALARLEGGGHQRVPRGFLFANLESREMFDAEKIVVGLGEGANGTEIEVNARARSVEKAQEIERRVLETRREGLEELEEEDELEPAVKSLVRELVDGVRFERRGADLAAGFSFGSREREMQILGVGTALVVSAIDRYLRVVKTSEARNAMWMIHGSLREYAMRQKPPRFPKSAPLVPQQVPAGNSYQSAEADWQQAGWKDIGFNWGSPQHYALGFETAPGGRKVTVRALGDLDGDGVQAKFELDLEIRQGQVIGDGEMREENPDE